LADGRTDDAGDLHPLLRMLFLDLLDCLAGHLFCPFRPHAAGSAPRAVRRDQGSDEEYNRPTSSCNSTIHFGPLTSRAPIMLLRWPNVDPTDFAFISRVLQNGD
jgi:hypothetical protein